MTKNIYIYEIYTHRLNYSIKGSYPGAQNLKSFKAETLFFTTPIWKRYVSDKCRNVHTISDSHDNIFIGVDHKPAR